MTKNRDAASTHYAVERCAKLIGYEACAEAIGKTEWTIRKFSDPDGGRNISVEHAIALDDACAAGAGERPFLIMWLAHARAAAAKPGASLRDRFVSIVEASGAASARLAVAIDPAADFATRRVAAAALESLMVETARCLAALNSDKGEHP